MKPYLAIDARAPGHSFRLYTSALLHGLLKQNSLKYEVFVLVQKNQNTDFVPEKFKKIICQSEFLNPSEWFEIPKILKKNRINLFHSPTYCSFKFLPCPWIVTIHDLNHLIYGGVPQKIYYRFFLKPFALKAKQIVSVSEFSKREISHWLDLPESDIQVAYNAFYSPDSWKLTAPEILKVLKEGDLQKGGYFFTLAPHKKHKNLLLLREAYLLAREKNPHLSPWVVTTEEAELEGEGIVQVGGVSDREAQILISNSKGFLFPSLYEGFGKPPVEAVLWGIPVVLSDILPHRESLGSILPMDAHSWVKPTDCNAWCEAFLGLESGQINPASKPLAESLLERFNSQRLANAMDQIYLTVLGLGS